MKRPGRRSKLKEPIGSEGITQRIIFPTVLDRRFMEVYTDSISGFNPKAREILGKLSIKDDVIVGCSPLMAVHLENSGILGDKRRVIGRPELETLLYFNSRFIRGRYTDVGLVLRSSRDSYRPHDILAKVLAEELKKFGVQINKGKLIPFAALKLKEDTRSDYGLVFELKDDAAGLIKDLDKYKWGSLIKEGISAASYIGRIDGFWNGGNRRIAASDADGRVVTARESYEPDKIRKVEENNMIELMNKRRFSEAIQIAKRELKSGSDYLTFYCMATALWQMERAKAGTPIDVPEEVLEQVVNLYEQSLLYNPLFSHAYFLLGALQRNKAERSMRNLDNPKESLICREYLDTAKQHFEKAAFLNPAFFPMMTKEINNLFRIATHLQD